MKAADTVMSSEQQAEAIGRSVKFLNWQHETIAKAQAEVSFKAGREQEHRVMTGKFIKVDWDLYWRIKASLRGIQIQQHNSRQITWRTQIDDVMEKMDELDAPYQ